jgi:hypothetical protein
MEASLAPPFQHAGSNLPVHGIYARGLHTDANLAGADGRLRHVVLERQDARTAERVEMHCSHGMTF